MTQARTVLSCLLLSAPVLYAANCDGMKQLRLPDTTINVAEQVTSGELEGPGIEKPLHELPAFCRVMGILRPTADSEIHFEVWMPEKDWNQRFLGVGNGGFAGAIGYQELAGNLRRGFATAGSDAGHQAEGRGRKLGLRSSGKDQGFRLAGGPPDRGAGQGRCQGVLRQGRRKGLFRFLLRWRARGADGGPAFSRGLRRNPSRRAGQCLDPHVDFGLSVDPGNDGRPTGYISSLKLPAIERASLAACDAADGVKDGFLSDPARCHFDPAVLLCKGQTLSTASPSRRCNR